MQRKIIAHLRKNPFDSVHQSICFAGVNGTLRPRWLQRRKGGPAIRMDMVNQSVYSFCFFSLWLSISRFYILMKRKNQFGTLTNVNVENWFYQNGLLLGEKVPGFILCRVFANNEGQKKIRRERLCEPFVNSKQAALLFAFSLSCTAVWIISDVFLCLWIFEFCTGMTVSTTDFYRM